MPPRRTQPSQQHAPSAEGAGPSNRETIPDYVTFTLIQSVMNDGIMPEGDFKAMVRRLMQRNNDDKFMPVLNKIQHDMSFLELTIERIKFPVNNGWYICLVNKEADEAAKAMGSKYTSDEVQFFRAVVDELCGAQPRAGKLLSEVGSMTLVNADVSRGPSQAASQQPAAKRRKLDLQTKEGLIRKFAQDGWLFTVRDGYYTLGPRTLGELKDLVLGAVTDEVAEKLRDEYL